jgi:protein-tyrosine phosphatase
VEYFHIFMMDVLSQDILGSGILHEALLYIEQAVRDKANVLVHWYNCEICGAESVWGMRWTAVDFSEAGISRSVTLAAAYVMRKFEWSAEKALLFIQRSRPIAS